MFDAHGHRRKLVIFTEHRDTLNYLTEKNPRLLGRPEARGQHPRKRGPRRPQEGTKPPLRRTKRLKSSLPQTPPAKVSNLQRGHLMVNYDLPWKS